jgi:hypothetical protein
MPKRVLDFDALWGSDKVAACAEWAQAEYAWLYGLADASGCFELSNLRVIWGRVAAIRRNLSIERLEQVFHEFEDKGLLFVWEYEGKRYGHWTGSDLPGRLPAPSWRMRLERLTPPVPKQKLAEYMSRFSRGRASLGGRGFRTGDSQAGEDGNGGGAAGDDAAGGAGHDNLAECEGVARGNAPERAIVEEPRLRREVAGRLKGGVEAAQGQDWNLNLDLNLDGNWEKEKNCLRDGGMQDQDGRRSENQREDRNQKQNANQNKNQQKNEIQRKNQIQQQNQNSVYVKANLTANARLTTGASLPVDADANCGESSAARNEAMQNSRSFAEAGNSGSPASLRADCLKTGSERRGWDSSRVGSWQRAGTLSTKEAYLLSELRVGTGPTLGPFKVRPEIFERVRARDEAARKKSRTG